ncbi:hypothetical protein AVEN_110965-1 [Araneus ventricosus]|uniref:Uncharacterized protein n=1 Tax=Araneus ventricosus TaxID=182803 RepID=A0A4Y2LGG5_ARAVE|nr:hypothetical protein AVEN_110965-1 [Araneus ventricosus]
MTIHTIAYIAHHITVDVSTARQVYDHSGAESVHVPATNITHTCFSTILVFDNIKQAGAPVAPATPSYSEYISQYRSPDINSFCLVVRSFARNRKVPASIPAPKRPGP